MHVKSLLLVLLEAMCQPACRGAEALRYRLNGLEVEATYARGPEAQGLVASFIEALPRDGSPARPGWTTHGSWRQIGLVEGRISRVLQVRGEGAELEAVTSALDTEQSPHPERPAPLGSPPASVLTTRLQFLHPTASLQWVYRSAWQVQSVATWLRLAAGVRGWNVETSPTPGDLRMSRRGDRLQVQVLPEARSSGGSIVVMTSWNSR